ncbi:helix-turn-helix transcriptional regulator [bacterium]|nr:helix-turn-helix transcriptional regulator [bacterium]
MSQDKLLSTIGLNIKIERIRARMTQEDLAELVKINSKHLGAIERGEVNLRVLTLVSLAKALDISLDKLCK